MEIKYNDNIYYINNWKITHWYIQWEYQENFNDNIQDEIINHILDEMWINTFEDFEEDFLDISKLNSWIDHDYNTYGSYEDILEWDISNESYDNNYYSVATATFLYWRLKWSYVDLNDSDWLQIYIYNQ